MNTGNEPENTTAAPRAKPAVASTQDSAPTTAQLRATIPSGRTVSIDSAHEPAAASFDTDDEAAGRPAPAAAIRQAMAHEGRLPVQPPPQSAARSGVPVAAWIVVAIIAAVVVWLFLR